MRAISRSRKVPVTIASPPEALAAPRQTKMGLKAHQKQKAPRGAFQSSAPRGYRARPKDVAGGTGLPPPPARSEPRGAAHSTGTPAAVGTPACHVVYPATLDLYRQVMSPVRSWLTDSGLIRAPHVIPGCRRALPAGEELHPRADRRRAPAGGRPRTLGERADAYARRLTHDRQPGAARARLGRRAGACRRRRYLRRRAARARPPARGAQHRR